MQKENSIIVKDVTKDFKVFYDKGNSLKEKLLFKNRNKYENRHVLKGISFNVHKGEAIGLIGKNGCGKSTLLKLLSRIIYPNKGSIQIDGRVSSLIELGAGFHPDMSGRENIYTNASIFGLDRKEINNRLDDIIKFSELQDFLDNPVRTYSSGMYMRLAFSVAINVDADILLIDEILAVGDVSFQKKCFEKLKEIKAKGTTIVIVSHSLGQIEQICDRTIWIDNGLIKEEGIPKFVHENYLAAMEEKRLDNYVNDYNQKLSNDLEERPDFCDPNYVRTGNKFVEIIDVKLLNKNYEQSTIFKTGDKIIIKIFYKRNKDNIQGNFGVGINRDDGVYCYGTSTLIENDKMIDINEKGVVSMIIENNILLPAKYILDVAIHSYDEIAYDRIHHVMEFQVLPNKKDFGVSRIENIWYIDEIE
ncbi:ATP-binding cassette domain-containing protein [Anaerocolumna sedimenticola]|uniref:ATP-binding cassette domain-containing protein n=1 Tax=Anaerocolumna sedimenticola TaxID=2696063 RepID=A0A6P1TLL9_9FIRM|nr:ABC transporter ATP-binding protein [Anaerocolumna sedimenticola]QHQ61059.1 ATP-binding cassette domain-containing protein [Anaerocolumna sedimenticola]